MKDVDSEISYNRLVFNCVNALISNPEFYNAFSDTSRVIQRAITIVNKTFEILDGEEDVQKGSE